MCLLLPVRLPCMSHVVQKCTDLRFCFPAQICTVADSAVGQSVSVPCLLVGPPALQSHFSRRQQRRRRRQEHQLPEWHSSPGLGPDLAHDGCPAHAAVVTALTAGSMAAAARPQAGGQQQQHHHTRRQELAAGGQGLGSDSCSAGDSSRDWQCSARGEGREGSDDEGGPAHCYEAEAQALLESPRQRDQGHGQQQHWRRQGQARQRLDTNLVISLMLTEAGIIFHSGGCWHRCASMAAPAWHGAGRQRGMGARTSVERPCMGAGRFCVLPAHTPCACFRHVPPRCPPSTARLQQ